MPFSKFQKELDTWTKELVKSGMVLIRRTDKYVHEAEPKTLQDRQFIIEVLHPSRHQYWVQFGPSVSASLPRVLWSFSFDPQNESLIEIGVRDRSQEGIVMIKTKEPRE